MPAKSGSRARKTPSKKKSASSKPKTKAKKAKKTKAPKSREAAKLNKIFDELKEFRKEASMLSERISSLDSFKELKHASEFKDSLDNLTFVVNRVYELFSQASDEMYQEHELNSERINPLASKLDKLIELNTRLSEGILGLLKELKELKSNEIKIEKELQTVKLRSDVIALKEAGKDVIEGAHDKQEKTQEHPQQKSSENPYYQQQPEQENSNSFQVTNPKRILPK